jgi:hypothetical protein
MRITEHVRAQAGTRLKSKIKLVLSTKATIMARKMRMAEKYMTAGFVHDMYEVLEKKGNSAS